MRGKGGWLFIFAAIGLVMAVLGLAFGSVHIPVGEVWEVFFKQVDGPYRVIVRQVRLPEVLTAAVAGAGLATAGLLMQTVFHNPLAGPGVLGISGGASVGVALAMLAQPLWAASLVPQDLLVAVAALAGAFAVLLLIMVADRRLGDGITLLILGLMVGYLCTAMVSVLQAASEAKALKGFVLWGLGSFAGMELSRLPWLALPILAGLAGALGLMKPMNALLIGDEQAGSMGVDVPRVRRRAICLTGLLAGVITAFCGPIAFLGLAVPHVARAILRTADHRVLLPATMLLGAALALLADVIVRTAGGGAALPLNAVTSLMGAPVVLWVLWSGRQWGRR
ncbi:MAG TPA: iron ABC transporter permease [Flavobacteriales bacterium]|nr:iron ABC transporter permease [Flavobacteriales bacterium]